MSEKSDATVPADENQIVAERRGKLNALRTRGNAYPNDFGRDALAGELHEAHGRKTHEELEQQAIAVAVAGRMLLKRVMGKASFATLQDMSGRIQLYITTDAPMDVMIDGAPTVHLEPWQAHFFKGGTVHGFHNPNPRTVRWVELFALKAGGAVALDENAARAIAMAFAKK